MQVVGYTFDADVYCEDCTDLAKAGGALEEGEDGEWFDSENNPIHPIFDTTEVSVPTHCSVCHAYIDASWNGEAVNYATEAFVAFIDGWLEGKTVGDPDVLEYWSDEMSSMVLDKKDERARFLLNVVLDEMMEPNV